MARKNKILLFASLCTVIFWLSPFALWRNPSPAASGHELIRATESQSNTMTDESSLSDPSAIDQHGVGLREPLEKQTVDDPHQLDARGEAARLGAHKAAHRIVVTDLDGGELPGESGELWLAPQDGAAVQVPFQDGQFSLDGFSEGRVDIRKAEVFSSDGKRFIALELDRFEFRHEQPVLLKGQFLPDAELRVVDHVTGSALSGIRVLPGDGDPKQAHPGPHSPSAFIARADASPLKLPPNRRIQPYWVTAKGYGWSFIRVDHETGGEWLVRLESAGNLVVQVDGDVESYLIQSVNAYIRVYRAGTVELAASSDLSSEHRFNGLAAGNYDVRVELNSTHEEDANLGFTEIDVTHGTTAVARIELRVQERIEGKVGVTGDVILPKKYATLGLVPSLRVQPVDGLALRPGDLRRFVFPSKTLPLRFIDAFSVESTPMQGRYSGKDGAEIFRWEADLSAGDYLLVVEPFQYGVEQSISATHDSKVIITVPELFPITVRAIDSRTRKTIDGATVRWSRTFAEGEAGGWVEADLGDGVDPPDIYLAAGAVTVSTKAPGYADSFSDVLIGSGIDQVTHEMSPCFSRDIVLMYEGAVVPWADEVVCRFRPLGSENSQPTTNPGDGTMQACFLEHGLHEILIGKIKGFREIAPVMVDVIEGDRSSVIVELER